MAYVQDQDNRGSTVNVGDYIYDSDIVATRYLVVCYDTDVESSGWNVVDLSDGALVFDGDGASRGGVQEWVEDDSARRLMTKGERFTVVIE